MKTKDRIAEIFKRFHENNPEPKGELKSVNAYTLLVAVVLSAQATDVGVNKATEKLFKIVDTPEKMIKLGITKLKDHIKTIGLYNAKAENVMKLSQMLIDDYESKVPDTMDELIKLPGVGRKTANVVLNIEFGHHTIAVDTHVFRVSNRLKIAEGTSVEAVEEKLDKVIPTEYKRHAHHWLILHGRYICKARRPLCEECFLNDICPSSLVK